MGMPTSQLRLAVALGHALPGGTIDLTFDDGTRMRAAHDTTAVDVMTPCGLRALLVMGAWPLCAGASDRITSMTIGGAGVCDLGGGVYRRDDDEDAERWIATLLAPTTVGDVLASCPLEFSAAVDASLRPDGDLGVTVVVLSGEQAREQHALDDASRWAASALYVEELVRDLQGAC